jgi:hypothetical protein
MMALTTGTMSKKATEDFINSQCTHIALLDLDRSPVTEIRPIPKDGSGVTFDPAKRTRTAYFVGFFNDEHVPIIWIAIPPGGDTYHWPGVQIDES